MKAKILQEIQESASVIGAMAKSAEVLSAIEAAATLCRTALQQGNKVLLAGNGGSAADCQHIAGELVARFKFDRPGLPAIALTVDSSVMTAIGNDYGYDVVFARQVEALARKDDILFAYSTSGKSPNILKAIEAARRMGARVIGMTGNRECPMRAGLCDVVIAIPSTDTPKIQEGHLVAGHLICDLVESGLFTRGRLSRTSAMEKPALVFLCQRIPYPPIKGERITSYNLLRHLTRKYRVFLGTFIDDPADRSGIDTMRGMVEDLYVGEVRKPWAYFTALPRWLAGEPISYALFRSRALGRWLDEVERRHRPVAVVTHSSNISAYAVDWFRRGGKNEPRRLLHYADVDSEKFVAYAERASGIMRWVFDQEAKRVRREERRMTALADVVTLVTPEETELFLSVLETDRERIATLPNGVDTDLFDPDVSHPRPFEGGGPTLAFTGAMDYPPNVEAVRWFAAQVFPRIRDAIPDARFLIVGAKPTAEVQALAEVPGVVVTGRVPSVAAYLAHVNAAVAPLQIARGIQNKVLEAMAMAVPTVVSPGALTGIDAVPSRHILCASTPGEWLEACLGLLRDPDKARQMGRAARQLVMDKYNWDAQFARLDTLLAATN